MIAALICVMFLWALIQSTARWRLIRTTISAPPLSSAVEAATGIANDAIGADRFEMSTRASQQMCPTSEERGLWLKEVPVYYRVLRACLNLGGTAFPPLSNRMKRELEQCAKFAAAIPDRRLNASSVYASDGQHS